MKTPREFLDAGDLQAALETATKDVKRQPAEYRHRTALFELLCFAGQWDRAEKQLDALETAGGAPESGIPIYRDAVAAERARELFWRSGQPPQFLMEPPAYVVKYLEAAQCLCENDLDRAGRLLDEAEEERPARKARLDECEYPDWRDYADWFPAVLETFAKGKYVWLVFDQIGRITFQPPQRLRDLLWLPARVETVSGEIGEVLLPTLYALSHEHPNDLVKLGRATEWSDLGAGLQRAFGLKMFWLDGVEKTILEPSSVEFPGE